MSKLNGKKEQLFKAGIIYLKDAIQAETLLRPVLTRLNAVHPGCLLAKFNIDCLNKSKWFRCIHIKENKERNPSYTCRMPSISKTLKDKFKTTITLLFSIVIIKGKGCIPCYLAHLLKTPVFKLTVFPGGRDL